MNRDTSKQGTTRRGKQVEVALGGRIAGLAGWLFAHLRHEPRPAPRLILRQRIALGPRQHVSLIEADGRRFLVATGSENGSTFHALDPQPRPGLASTRRTSW